jgi:hypothetical protein
MVIPSTSVLGVERIGSTAEKLHKRMPIDRVR